MRVVVTGGSGKVGRAAIRALKAAGHKPINFDLAPSPDGGRFVRADMADMGQALDALSGVDTHGGPPEAVVHLAAVPGPGHAPDHTIFQTNVMSAYNVFSACRRLGIKRIVWASSETLLGLPFDTPPEFAPLDETHTDRPEWSYSLSKLLGEAMARTFVRWSPDTSVTSLRFSNVYDIADYQMIGQIQRDTASRRGNLWAYVDARDAGEACRLALEAGQPGHEAMIVAAADTVMDVPTRELLAQYFPDVPIRGDLRGFDSLLSSRKAGEMIGYQPKHSWRDEVKA